MRTALAYKPRRARLQRAGVPAALAYLGSFVVLAFVYSNPIMLAATGCGVVVAGLAAGAREALAAALRWGLWLAVLVVTVNGLVTHRGATVWVRGFDAPVLGQLDITMEALAEGAVLALRILVVVIAFAVYSACLDPDRVLRLLRPVAARSALTATLITRLVPVAAADHVRLKQAAALRGPAAAPAGRAALARRLVAGSLDRSVDVAATLELRGYGLTARALSGPLRGSRHDWRFLAAGATLVALGLGARLSGVGDFEPYPTLALDAGRATLALAAAIPMLAWAPFAGERTTGRRIRRAPALNEAGTRA